MNEQIGSSYNRVFDTVSHAARIAALAGALVAPDAQEAEAAHIKSPAPLLKAERAIENSIKRGEPQPIATNHNVLIRGGYASTDPNSAEFDYKVEKPIVGYVNNEPRYFELMRAGTAKKPIVKAKILPEDVVTVVSDGAPVDASRFLHTAHYRLVRLDKSNAVPSYRKMKYGSVPEPVAQRTKLEPQNTAVNGIKGYRFANVGQINNLDRATNLNEAEQALDMFGQQYNVRFEIMDGFEGPKDEDGREFTRLDQLDLPAVKTIGRLVIDEWSKTPLELISTSLVHEVFLNGSIKVTNGNQKGEAGGLMSQSGGWITFPVRSMIRSNEAHRRETVHHEIQHSFGLSPEEATSWTALGPQPYLSSSGYVCLYDSAVCGYGKYPSPGFVSAYSRSSFIEDTAETYANMMTQDGAARLSAAAQVDSVLAAKVNLMKAHLNWRTNGFMNDAYFQQINPPYAPQKGGVIGE